MCMLRALQDDSLTREEVVGVVLEVLTDRRNLALTIKANESITGSLESCINVILQTVM